MEAKIARARVGGAIGSGSTPIELRFEPRAG